MCACTPSESPRYAEPALFLMGGLFHIRTDRHSTIWVAISIKLSGGTCLGLPFKSNGQVLPGSQASLPFWIISWSRFQTFTLYLLRFLAFGEVELWSQVAAGFWSEGMSSSFVVILCTPSEPSRAKEWSSLKATFLHPKMLLVFKC